jgi:alpha-tubulin suppressor-like RCC1 family protein
MWGSNGYGKVGNNTVDSAAGSPSQPTQIGALTNWAKVEASRRKTFWLKTDGTIWSCGYNDSGALGLNLPFPGSARSSPVQIGSLTGWTAIESNYATAGGIKNGEIYMWGFNGSGRLGDNTTISRSSPVQVGSLNTWSKLSLGYDFCLAIKTDGTLWTWGRNSYGTCGQNNSYTAGTGPRFSSPVQIGSDTNWAECAAGTNIAFAIKTSGSLWSWGFGNYGQLGQNDNVSRSSPTQIGGLLTWNKIVTGNSSTFAIKTDNTLWVWGRNVAGSLGLNNTTETSSPTQVGALQNWSLIGINDVTCMAVKTDGTLWGWGYGVRNMFDATSTSRSSPVQIGSRTDWIQAKAGRRQSTGAANGAQAGGITQFLVNPG